MEHERGNECKMLFKWEWCDFLLLDSKERVDVAFSTPISYFRKLFEFLRGYFQRRIS